jgi:hypothetical protein
MGSLLCCAFIGCAPESTRLTEDYKEQMSTQAGVIYLNQRELGPNGIVKIRQGESADISATFESDHPADDLSTVMQLVKKTSQGDEVIMWSAAAQATRSKRTGKEFTCQTSLEIPPVKQKDIWLVKVKPAIGDFEIVGAVTVLP